ncbi:putative gustatory receptor 28b [Fopius arisanus]|uniref:Gustatory receptor n=2 Tax=Fopius arisanus TaxID=64838 RepID=A0A9R1U9V2_9HYME|nr:PREDICTED: putative gustatory receptor 28b [Fopius arisanus]XP_011312594.1 PREDICTED: putative gustatory receptor 28b [Fopius arisanus]
MKNLVSSNTGKMKAKKPVILRGSESRLYTAVCPFVYIFRIFGVAPYEFADDTLVPSCGNAIFSFVWIFGYSYIIYGVLTGFYHVDRGSLLLGHTETVKTVFNFLVSLMDIFIALYYRLTFTKIWNSIQDYDEKIRELGYARSERRAGIFVWSALVVAFVMILFIHRLGMFAFVQSWWDNVSYLLVYIGTAISIVKFSSILLLLADRFQQLNQIAINNIPVKPRWINIVPVVNAKTIERLHDDLMVMGEALVSMYSWSLMAWVINLSFHLVFNLYFVIDWILKPGNAWALVFCLLSWTVAFTAQLILLHYSCDWASTEASKMAYIMLSWKRWLYTRDRGLIVETSLHLKMRRLDFTAAGCFDVNLPLLRSITATLTTYLVILLQFSETPQ